MTPLVITGTIHGQLSLLESAGIVVAIIVGIAAAIGGVIRYFIKRRGGSGDKGTGVTITHTQNPAGTISHTQGQSIVAGGDVNVGLSPAAEKRLLKELDAKDFALVERGQRLEDAEKERAELEKEKEELQKRLQEREPGDARRAEARGKVDAGDYEGAEQILQEAFARSGPEAAADAYELGLVKDLQLDFPGARSYFQQAAGLEPGNSTYISQYGTALDRLADHMGAIAEFEKALAIDRKALGEQHPHTAIDYNNLGSAWQDLGESGKAIGYYEKALAITRKALGEQNPAVATRYNNLGSAWGSLGEHRKAIKLHEKALDIKRKALGEQHPATATSYNNLGGEWYAMGELRKAVGYYEKALDITRKALGEEHPDTAACYNNLGGALDSLGEYSKAIILYEKALPILKAKLPAGHPHILLVEGNLEKARREAE